MLAEPGSNLLRRQPPYGIYAYTGREWDPEINLHYYRARYYEPKVGRFLSEDPLGVAKPHPDNRVAMAVAREHNLYVYVSSNPIRFTDPLGLKRTKFPPSPPQCKLPTPPCSPMYCYFEDYSRDGRKFCMVISRREDCSEVVWEGVDCESIDQQTTMPCGSQGNNERPRPPAGPPRCGEECDA